MKSARVDTVVVGASAAGLATSACLKKAGLDHVLLEREAHVAHTWRNHYDRLHLHTPRGGSGLPGLPMPSSYPKYPSRDQVVDYLEDYAAKLELRPQFGQEVRRVARTPAGWQVETQDQQIACTRVVIASGYTNTPRIPSWPGQEGFVGQVLHSSAYRTGATWSGHRVLVVGFGNSGGEIAIDLVEHHAAAVTLSVRSPVNVIPRDLFGIPILSVGIVMSRLGSGLADAVSAPILRAAVGDIRALGLRKLPYGPFTQITREGRIPLLDIGTLQLVKDKKIEIQGGIERFSEQAVRFEGGVERPVDAVVLATGYTPSLERFIEPVSELVDERGVPRASGSEVLPGLFCCGFYVAPTGMLREIGIEARRIATAIAEKGA
jgi:indole-3-pyruvate monooxygenase